MRVIHIGVLCCFLVSFTMTNALAEENEQDTDLIKFTLSGGAATALRGGKDIEAGGAFGAGFSAPAPFIRGFKPLSSTNLDIGILANPGDETTVDSDYGAFILNPRQDTRSGQLTASLRSGEKWPIFGILYRLGAASANFTKPGENEEEVKSDFSSDIFHHFFGIQFLTGENGEANNKFQAEIELGYAQHTLGGDLGQESDEDASTFRSEVIGLEDKKRIRGLEAGVSFWVNSTHLYLRLSWLQDKPSVSGLTGIRFLIGADALADILTLSF